MITKETAQKIVACHDEIEVLKGNVDTVEEADQEKWQMSSPAWSIEVGKDLLLAFAKHLLEKKQAELRILNDEAMMEVFEYKYHKGLMDQAFNDYQRVVDADKIIPRSFYNSLSRLFDYWGKVHSPDKTKDKL